jgi:hypothetical protein
MNANQIASGSFETSVSPLMYGGTWADSGVALANPGRSFMKPHLEALGCRPRASVRNLRRIAFVLSSLSKPLEPFILLIGIEGLVKTLCSVPPSGEMV